MPRYLALIVLTIPVIFLNSCTLLRLQKEVDILDQLVPVEGNIINPYPEQGPVMLGAIKIRGKDDYAVVGGDVFYNSHEFKLHLLPGHYFLLAYQDSNDDQIFQSSENVGWYGEPWEIIKVGETSLEGIDVKMYSPMHARLAIPSLYTYDKDTLKNEIPEVAFDQVTTLDNPDFNLTNAQLGLWEPIRFIQTVPSGFYFLEPYHEEKIPVIFVHGVSGHPAIWKTIVSKLDRSKFQPWFYYYPSGLRIDSLGQWLSSHLYQLQGRYNFDHVYLVAHSMGGLVSRVAINDFIAKDRGHMIKLFISLSTPWGGHKLASQGLQFSPVVIPNWHDMAPDSEMLKQIFNTPLPESLPFELFFSFRGESSLMDEDNSDGVIALQSQLRQEAQDGSVRIRGFDEGHTSILDSTKVAETLNTVLMRRFSETKDRQ